MALPTAINNIVGTHVYPLTDLGLASSIPNATPGAAVSFSTGLPGTVVFLTKLSSGTCSIAVNVSDTSADAISGLGAPTTTISATTSRIYATVATSDNAVAQMQDYPASSPLYVAAVSDLWVAMQQTAVSSGCLFQEFVILVLFELRGNEDWFSVAAGGMNSVAGCAGGTPTLTAPAGYQDGSGTFDPTGM